MSAFTNDGTENQMRWTPEAGPFMEVWYTTLSHPASGRGVWIRYTITSPDGRFGAPYCELWGFVFHPDGGIAFAGKERFPIDHLGRGGRDDGALVRIGDAWASETHLEGSLSGQGGDMTWSLDFQPATETFHHIPAAMRRRSERKFSVVCSPNLSVPFAGTVRFGSDELVFDGERGCQGHRWGRSHAGTWAWAHCDVFDGGEDAVFEGVAAKSSLGPVPLPTLSMMVLRLDGRAIEFNDPRWLLKARSSYAMPTWAFSAVTSEWRLVGAARTKIDRLVQVRYVDPDSTLRHCANSEVADLAIELYRRNGGSWTHHRSLTATGTAHAEFGRREPFTELPVTL